MDIHKKHVIISCTLLFLGIIFPFTISAQKSFKNSFQDLDPIQAPLIPAPSDTTQWKHFKKSLLKWREQIHENLEGMILLYCGMPTLVLVLTQEINLISIEICRVD